MLQQQSSALIEHHGFVGTTTLGNDGMAGWRQVVGPLVVVQIVGAEFDGDSYFYVSVCHVVFLMQNFNFVQSYAEEEFNNFFLIISNKVMAYDKE